MDEKYFEKMAVECVTLPRPLIEIVKQIALDARREALEEAKGAVELLRRKANVLIPWRTDILDGMDESIKAIAALDGK